MDRIRRSFLEIFRDESGATAIEYGLVAAFVSLTIIASATFFGNSVSTMLMAAANRLTGF